MILSPSTRRLIKRRTELKRQLAECLDTMLRGTASETYRQCGKDQCRCAHGHLHGPHLYVSYATKRGKTTGYYPPACVQSQVGEGLRTRRRFDQLADEIAAVNEAIVREEGKRWLFAGPVASAIELKTGKHMDEDGVRKVAEILEPLPAGRVTKTAVAKLADRFGRSRRLSRYLKSGVEEG